MLHRDYILELIEEFVNTVVPLLRRAHVARDLDAAREAEAAVAELLDLDPSCALALAPASLVTMTRLSGVGETLAGHAAFALAALARVYAEAGLDDVAGLRAEQARALGEAFGCDPDDVPEGMEGLVAPADGGTAHAG